MRKHYLFLTVLMLLSFYLNVGAQDYALSAPFGYGANTTGGTGGTVVTVTTMADLVAQLKSSGKKIILVSGNLTCTKMQQIEGAKDKTVIGLPGATLSNSKRDKSGSGILYFSTGSSNLIFRNLTFKSAGAYDTDGNDNLCFDGVTNAWVDHCDFQDGVDGNFDNKGNTDNVTVSWCRFRYLIAPLAGGSGGSDDHRFTNLLGSDKDDKPSDGRYNITWAYCWWDTGCKERMVRGRNADLHFLNCYWNSSVANYYIGPENLGAYVEGCMFEGKPTGGNIFKSYGGTNPVKFVNCAGNTLPSNSGNPVVPNYSYTALTAAAAKTAVSGSCGAGATLQVNATTSAVSSACNATEPTISLASAPATASQTVTQGTAMQELLYTYGGTATGFEVTYNGSATKPAWLTYNNGKFTGTPTGYTASTTLTIKIKAIGGGDSSAEMTATITINVPLPSLAAPVASYTMSGTTANVSWGAVANASSYNVKVCTTGGGGSSKNITFNDATVETVTGDRNLAVGVDVIGSTKAKIATRNGTYGGVNITKYFDFGGGGSVTSNALKVAFDGGGTLSVYNNSADNGRTINISDGTSVIGSITTNDGTVTIPAAGNYYLYSTGSGIQVYVLQFTSSSTCTTINTKNTSYSVENAEGATISVQAVGNGSSYESSAFAEATMVAEKVDATLTLAGGNTNQSLKTNENLTAITYNYTGTPSISWSGKENTAIAPAGVNVNITATQIIITGTPTEAGNYGYSISAAGINGGKNASQLNGTITVTLAPVNASIMLSSAAGTNAQSVAAGTAIVSISYNYTGSAAAIVWTPSTPVGISGTTEISGTPTVAGTYSYTITVSGINGGAEAKASGTITVLPALTVPTNIQATPGETSVHLSWDAVAGADKYILKLCHDEEVEDTGSGIITLLTLADFTESVAGGVTVNADGSITKTAGATSTRIKTGTKDLRGATLNIVYTLQTAGSQQLKLNDDNNNSNDGRILNLTNTDANTTQSIELTGATGTDFLCFRLDSKCGITIHSLTVTKEGEGGGTGGGTIITPVCVETYETATNSITIPNLTSETEYTYQVKAVRGTEQTAYSTGASTTTTAEAPVKQDPTAPTGLTAIYGETLANVELPTGWTWTVAATTSVGNAGNNLFYVNFAGDEFYNAANNVQVTVNVVKANITKPALNNTAFTYDGSAKTVALNATGAYALSGQTQTNAGSYQAIVVLNDKTNTQWADGLTDDLKLDWTIAAAKIAIPTLAGATPFIYDGSEKSVSVEANAAYTVGGTQSATNAGNYTVTVTLVGKTNYQWTNGTTAVLQLQWKIELPTLNKQALMDEIAEKQEQFVNSSRKENDYANYQAVLNTMQDAMAVFNTALLQSEIDDAYNALNAVDLTALAPDKTALQQAIVEAEGLNEAEYTEETWQDLQAVLNDAKTVEADNNALISEVDKATDDLNDAINALEKKPVVSINDVKANSYVAYQQGNYLVVKGNVQSLTVYGTGGALIAKADNTNSVHLGHVSTGTLIVRINETVVKKVVWK